MMLKVCGATTEADVRLLADAGADMVGLWFSVPAGRADLSVDRLAVLAAEARACGIIPILVTFSSDLPLLRHAIEASGVTWIQLHAYQPPPVIRGLRATFTGELNLVKVLHMRDGACVEKPFLSSYERAGTDYFLLDKVSADGRIGSTGQRLSSAEVMEVVDTLHRPFLLAGGISSDNRADYDPVVSHALFYGVDVDSAARNADGLFESSSVANLSRVWGTARRKEAVAA